MSDNSTSRHSTGRGPSWIAPAALVIAVVAAALAIFSAVTRTPAPVSVPAVEGQKPATAGTADPAESKTQLCQAFTMVRDAVSLQTNANIGNDPAAQQAVAANARLATLGGGQFLLSRLADAAPTELTDAIRSFAVDLQYVGIGQLAGVAADDASQTGRTASAQETATRLGDMCK